MGIPVHGDVSFMLRGLIGADFLALLWGLSVGRCVTNTQVALPPLSTVITWIGAGRRPLLCPKAYFRLLNLPLALKCSEQFISMK